MDIIGYCFGYTQIKRANDFKCIGVSQLSLNGIRGEVGYCIDDMNGEPLTGIAVTQISGLRDATLPAALIALLSP